MEGSPSAHVLVPYVLVASQQGEGEGQGRGRGRVRGRPRRAGSLRAHAHGLRGGIEALVHAEIAVPFAHALLVRLDVLLQVSPIPSQRLPLHQGQGQGSASLGGCRGALR